MMQAAWVAWTPSNLACSSKEVLETKGEIPLSAHSNQALNGWLSGTPLRTTIQVCSIRIKR